MVLTSRLPDIGGPFTAIEYTESDHKLPLVIRAILLEDSPCLVGGACLVGLKQSPTELWSSQTKSQHNRR